MTTNFVETGDVPQRTVAERTDASPVPADAAPLETAVALFHTLQRRGVRYCHWKSNLRLAHALAGKTDLDLLVDRADSQIVRQTLDAYDVKPVLAAPGKAYPGVENYLGFDRASGELFHLHVHYQLVLGEQFVKNYRLPLERHLLDSVYNLHGVPVPAPEWELVVLALRALLKYRDRDAVKDILAIRSPGIPAHIRQEIQWLLAQTTLDCVRHAVSLAPHVIPGAAVIAFLEIMQENQRAGQRLFRLRSQVRRALRPYQRYTRVQAVGQYGRELWRRSKRMHRQRASRKMTSHAGGQTLALIGADGAGKSTHCAALTAWLGWKLDVRCYYLGSKQPSRRSKLLYMLFRGARRSYRTACQRFGAESGLARPVRTLRDLLLWSHYLSIGRDRYLRCWRGSKEAMGGSLIIYDRYPVASMLDGPKIWQDDRAHTGRLAQRLAQMEQALYRTLPAPDCVLALDVDPAVSLQRKPDHDRAAIEAKSRLVRSLTEETASAPTLGQVVYVDANQPRAAVLQQLKVAIWQRL